MTSPRKFARGRSTDASVRVTVDLNRLLAAIDSYDLRYDRSGSPASDYGGRGAWALPISASW